MFLAPQAVFVTMRTVIYPTTQDQRIAQDYLDGIVIKHLFPDGDNIAADVRVRIPTRPQRVGNDSGSFPGCDEKKAVAEILNGRVDIRRVCDRSKPPRHVWIPAGRFGGSGE